MENTETTKRELSILDFFDTNEDSVNHNHNKHYDKERIAKNQQQYGHRKRIKP
jgi:hypothetical protein